MESLFLLSEPYPSPIPQLISFALYTESSYLSLYSQLRAPYNFILFYFLFLVFLAKLLSFLFSKAPSTFTYSITDQQSSSQLLKLIQTRTEELKNSLTPQEPTGDPGGKLKEIDLELGKLEDFSMKFQSEIFALHGSLWEEIGSLRMNSQTMDYLKPPEEDADSGESYIPPQEALEDFIEPYMDDPTFKGNIYKFYSRP